MTSSHGNPQTLPFDPSDTMRGTTLRVRHISTGDLADALRSGARDFMRQPSQLVFLALIYPVAGVFLARLVMGYEVLPLLFPLVAGFAILGPLTAVGLYEISRRREAGMAHGWRHAFDVLRSPAFGSIAYIGLLLLTLFLVWLVAAMGLYAWSFGNVAQASLGGFLHRLFGTPEGWRLIIVGNVVGLAFAVLAMCLSVVSLPLLVDRKVNLGTALRTSFAAVAANPWPMALWGLTVLVGLALGAATFFVGLAVVLPVLGHATWHLYRRLVV